MIDETEGKAKLTAAWRAAVARMIEAGYTSGDVHETLISVGMSGTRRSRHSYMLPVGVAVVSVSAVLLFSDLVSINSSAIWRTLLGSASEQQRDNALLETRQAFVLARALANTEAVRAAEAQGVEQQEALAWEREEAEHRERDLADARSEIEALKAEGSRALSASRGPNQSERRRASGDDRPGSEPRSRFDGEHFSSYHP